MNHQPQATRSGRSAPLAGAIGLMLVVPLGLYLLAAAAAAWADGEPPAEVVCFQPATVAVTSALRQAIAAVMALAAVGFLFVVPALLGTLAFLRSARTRASAHAWSLIVNSVALILLFLLLRHAWHIDRVSVVIAWFAWSVLLFVTAWPSGRFWPVLAGLGKRYSGGLAVGILIVLGAIVVFFPDQFVQSFTEDGTEACRLASSIREHALPYWEMETGNRMGTVMVTPAVVNSYWTCALQCLLGVDELSTRLPYWIWWLAIFATCYRMLRPPRGGFQPAAVPLALLVFLCGVLFSFYVGYNPYMADLGNQGVFDGMFTLFVLLALDCLRHRHGCAWALCAMFGLLIHYAGGVMLVLMLAAMWCRRPIERKQTLRWGLQAAGLVLAVSVFYGVYGWTNGSLPLWINTWDVEYVNDYLADAPRWSSAGLFAGYFLLGCGGVPALGLVLAFRRDPWQRTVATVTLLYLLIVLGSGYKNLHYLGPLLPIPIILFLMPAANGEPAGWKRSLWAACSLIVCIWLSWPAQRPTFTLNRQLGMNTTIATDDYLTAAHWARLRYELRRQGLMSWDCDQHTWVEYAELDPKLANPRPLVITDGDEPPRGYLWVASRRVEETDTLAKLYARDQSWIDWLKSQHPLRPLERYPPVFIPLADGPYSPHNNTLEDVRRLRWPW